MKIFIVTCMRRCLRGMVLIALLHLLLISNGNVFLSVSLAEVIGDAEAATLEDIDKAQDKITLIENDIKKTETAIKKAEDDIIIVKAKMIKDEEEKEDIHKAIKKAEEKIKEINKMIEEAKKKIAEAWEKIKSVYPDIKSVENEIGEAENLISAITGEDINKIKNEIDKAKKKIEEAKENKSIKGLIEANKAIEEAEKLIPSDNNDAKKAIGEAKTAINNVDAEKMHEVNNAIKNAEDAIKNTKDPMIILQTKVKEAEKGADVENNLPVISPNVGYGYFPRLGESSAIIGVTFGSPKARTAILFQEKGEYWDKKKRDEDKNKVKKQWEDNHKNWQDSLYIKYYSKFTYKLLPKFDFRNIMLFIGTNVDDPLGLVDEMETDVVEREQLLLVGLNYRYAQYVHFGVGSALFEREDTDQVADTLYFSVAVNMSAVKIISTKIDQLLGILQSFEKTRKEGGEE